MKYKLILADPPWSYKDKSGRDYKHGAAEKYDTMSLEDICNMPIQDIADKDCALFMWATTPLLPEAFKVLEAWGFKYKTTIYWRKIMSLGMGYWFRGQVEVCLVAIKGNVKAFRSQRPNFIETKARKHSQKPDQLYGLIEELEISPKIELFARERREGWDAWGNELPKTTQTLLEVAT
ncbi:MT-A70 family methyltransferase [Methanolobus sediminis]|uniref:MT-A70 family methyltransferase n=1 Tax=Methanolobus sediminis TaxID=3072978 RepID=A0AA51UL90_9EURY|nr:MT-A70 family methyltransferase [Methanolobus sediminis]WMW25158.1 MT-A70 family methyltransferase [Methanolobus sediminis]